MSEVDWPTNSAVPVFSGDLEDYELVGFTTFTLQGVRLFMLSRPLTAAEAASSQADFMMKGQALVIEREGKTGRYLAWLVVDGDPKDLPGFWPA